MYKVSVTFVLTASRCVPFVWLAIESGFSLCTDDYCIGQLQPQPLIKFQALPFYGSPIGIIRNNISCRDNQHKLWVCVGYLTRQCWIIQIRAVRCTTPLNILYIHIMPFRYYYPRKSRSFQLLSLRGQFSHNENFFIYGPILPRFFTQLWNVK